MTDEKNTIGRRKIRIHYILALVLLIHCAFYFVYWLAVGDFKAAVDQFIIDLIEIDLPYTIILMTLSGVIGMWSLGRLIGFRIRLRKANWHPSFMNWTYLGVWLVFIILFYASFVIILRENPSQRGVLVQLLNILRIGGDALIFLLVAVWLRRVILQFRTKMRLGSHRWPFTMGIALVLITIVGLWLLPALFPPNWAYQGDLPAKPALLAHRGASMLAPENTLAAVDLAAEYGAFGFETDVRISQDGMPFLMHDATLARTTNVGEVFPERV
jgi:hypothetical protein